MSDEMAQAAHAKMLDAEDLADTLRKDYRSLLDERDALRSENAELREKVLDLTELLDAALRELEEAREGAAGHAHQLADTVRRLNDVVAERDEARAERDHMTAWLTKLKAGETVSRELFDDLIKRCERAEARTFEVRAHAERLAEAVDTSLRMLHAHRYSSAIEGKAVGTLTDALSHYRDTQEGAGREARQAAIEKASRIVRGPDPWTDRQADPDTQEKGLSELHVADDQAWVPGVGWRPKTPDLLPADLEPCATCGGKQLVRGLNEEATIHVWLPCPDCSNTPKEGSE